MSGDNTSSISVLKHFKQAVSADYYVLLQTCYFPMSVDIIDGCISKINSYYDVIISVNKAKAEDRKMFWMETPDKDIINPLFKKWYNGQQFEEKVFIENGACYVLPSWFLSKVNNKNISDALNVKYYVCKNDYIDIDTEEDFMKAEKLAERL